MSVDQLKSACKEAGLKSTGKKEELVARLSGKARDVQWVRYNGVENLNSGDLKDFAVSVGLDGKGTKAIVLAAIAAKLVSELSALSEDVLRAALTDRSCDAQGSKDELVVRLQKKLFEVDEAAKLKVASGGLVDMDVPASVPTIRLASWNMCNLTHDSDHKLYDRIVGLLLQFDVIAVQEVLKEEVLPFLLAKMPGYDGKLSGQVGAQRKEFYGFLWRTSSIKCVQTGLFSDESHQIERPPFVGTFSCLNSKKDKFDFSIMTIHVLFGNSKSDRRGELSKLAMCAQVVLNATGKEKDLFIVGDFNFDSEDEGLVFRNAFFLDLVPTLTTLVKGWKDLKQLGFVALFHDPVRTTVGDVSLYDNIWLNPRHTGSNFVKRGCIAFDKEWFPGEVQKARNDVSDHRPVWIELRSDVDLDENVYGSLEKLAI